MFTQHSMQRKTIQNITPLHLLLVVLLTIVLPLTACSSQPIGNPENGERWFSLYRCNGCHGENGTGGRAVEIAGLEMRYSGFLRKLRNSRSSVMPSFPRERLSDQDAADIYLWLRNSPVNQQLGS